MANVSKLIFGVAIAAASMASPALAAHKGKPISTHQNRHVTPSSSASGLYNFVPPNSIYDPASRPYHYDPGQAPNGP